MNIASHSTNEVLFNSDWDFNFKSIFQRNSVYYSHANPNKGFRKVLVCVWKKNEASHLQKACSYTRFRLSQASPSRERSRYYYTVSWSDGCCCCCCRLPVLPQAGWFCESPGSCSSKKEAETPNRAKLESIRVDYARRPPPLLPTYTIGEEGKNNNEQQRRGERAEGGSLQKWCRCWETLHDARLLSLLLPT